MARIVFASAAYLGDVAPFVEPANRLVDRGHDVTFVLPDGFHALLGDERFRIASYPLDFSPAGMRSDPAHERLLRHPWANQIRLGRYWMRRGFVDDPATARTSLLGVLEGADVFVAHPTLGSATVPAARHPGVPVVVGQLFPMMLSTAAWGPPVGLRNLNFKQRSLNRAAWSAFAWGSGVALYDRTLNEHRRALGHEALRGNALLAWTEAVRTVVLVSRHYFGDEPADWDGWALCGFSPWNGPSAQRVDERLEEYINDGEAPILVCLGTSAAAGVGPAFATIAEGLRRQSLRPLLPAPADPGPPPRPEARTQARAATPGPLRVP